MKTRVMNCQIVSENDVVHVRRRARDVAHLLGFDRQDQTRIATSVSEIARNAFEYARGGQAEFIVDLGPVPRLIIIISDRGSGISELTSILSGTYHSSTGMGVGLSGSKRLMDEFSVETSAQGTTVTLAKLLPPTTQSANSGRLNSIMGELSKAVPTNPIQELKDQNLELLRALSEVREKQDELSQLNRELEETNRGVVALYGQLDEKAEALSLANKTKTRFLSNITHEFRSPLGSSINLAEMLLDGVDGELNEMQKASVSLIGNSLHGLLELVNDLLDLAKVEAGRIPVRAEEFAIETLFSTLRGVFAPVAAKNRDVQLKFINTVGDQIIFADESKVTQVSRNLISNALKYTDRGEVTVTARVAQANRLEIEVADSGIGIAEKNLSLIFEEFAQIDSAHQKKHKGTGIGLSLTRQLVKLLDGDMTVESTLGQGSRFTFNIPFEYVGASEVNLFAETNDTHVTTGTEAHRILMIDDEEDERYFLRSVLVSKFGFRVFEASSGTQGIELAKRIRPSAIVLDLNMPESDGFTVLSQLKSDEELRHIPVIIYSSKHLSLTDRDRLEQATAILSKSDLSEEELIEKMGQIISEIKLDVVVSHS